MTSHCGSNKKTNRIKQSVNNLKSSIFCGTKGFLTFNLALLSYLEYSLCDYVLRKSNDQEDNRPKAKIAQAYLNDGSIVEVEVREKKYNPYKFLKEGAVFAITKKRYSIY